MKDEEVNPLLASQPPTDQEHLGKQRAMPQEMLEEGREWLKSEKYFEASKSFAKSIMAFEFLIKNQLMTPDETVDLFR